MSQPFDRGCKVPVPGALDAELGEFWSDDPWEIMRSNNLSCFERNRMFLNDHGKDFMEVSYLSGADSDGDGRAVVAADFHNNGKMDLLVRQVGGGALKLYENRFPARKFLSVSLRGTRSNSQGIGARVTLMNGKNRVVREMFPHNSYRSQAPTRLHFGLGEFGKVDRLTVRWPSGEIQEFDDLRTDQHIIVTEGKSEIEVSGSGISAVR